MNDKQDNQVQTGIRISESLLERADEMAKKMSRPGLRVLRADVLRLALTEGMDKLEAEGKRR